MSAGYALHPAGMWYLHHPHRPKNRRRLFFGGRGGGCFRSRGGLTRSRLPSLVGWKSRLCKSGIRRGTVVSPDRVRAPRAMCRAVSKHGVYAGRALSTSLSSFWGTVRLAPGWSGGLSQVSPWMPGWSDCAGRGCGYAVCVLVVSRIWCVCGRVVCGRAKARFRRTKGTGLRYYPFVCVHGLSLSGFPVSVWSAGRMSERVRVGQCHVLFRMSECAAELWIERFQGTEVAWHLPVLMVAVYLPR